MTTTIIFWVFFVAYFGFLRSGTDPSTIRTVLDVTLIVASVLYLVKFILVRIAKK